MKSTTPKIYVSDSFKDVKHMHRSLNSMARKYGVYASTLSSALLGRPVQASFVAAVLHSTGMEFEKLFKVK